MKAVLISCFNYYNGRLKYIKNLLESMGIEVTYITSDFDHINKTKYEIDRKEAIQIQVPVYKKNLSLKRILSHYIFARRAYKEIKKIKPDLLYVMLPPNYLAKVASKYRNNNDIKLVFDLYDLWPETFPSLNVKKTMSIPFYLWKRLRNINLIKADFVITECKLYQDILKETLEKIDNDVLYLTKEKSEINSKPIINTSNIDICYLGSINNIIDIPLISETLNAINKIKPVTLHIIGDGEKRNQFINAVKRVGVKVRFYGKIYDEKRKREIFDKCYFGINIMKKTVCVGLTMKSIDYFQAGLPILNNIQADTFELVEKQKIGINITEENINNIANQIVQLNINQLLEMRKATTKVYENLFSVSAFNKQANRVIKRILNDSMLI